MKPRKPRSIPPAKRSAPVDAAPRVDEVVRLNRYLAQAGVALEDGPARADDVAYLDLSDHREVAMRLHEGRNRQVRRMMEALGHEVTRLERVHYAGLTTDGVRRGHWRRLSAAEVRDLRRRVKLP